MKKSWVSIMMVAAMSAGLLAGCGGSSESAESTSDETAANTTAVTASQTSEQKASSENESTDKTVITYWNGFTGTDGEVMQNIINEWNESNSYNAEIELSIVSWDTLYQQLATSLPVGEGPDIMACAIQRIPGYAESGALIPIDDIYESKQVNADKMPAVFNENLQYDGHYYGVPVDIATLCLYYNKDLFDEAGIDYPTDDWTWDDLQSAALELTKDIDGEHQYGFGMATNNTIQMWPIMLWAGGGDIITDNKSVLNSQENIDTITRWSDLIKNKGIGPVTCSGADIDTSLFSTGKIAMYFCGPWAAGSFDAAGVNYGIAGVPSGPAGKATLADGVGMYMTSSADESKKEAIYDFFAYWQSVDAQVEWSGTVGYPVANTDAMEDDRLADDEVVQLFSAQLPYAHFYLPQLSNFTEIDTDVLTPAIENILLNDVDITKTLNDASEQIDAMLSE